MYESPDNPASKPDIDGLFQKLAQDYEPPFDPAAWQQMQQRLDQQHYQPQPYALTRQLLLLLAVMFISGSQFQSGRASKSERSTAAIALADQPCQSDAPRNPAQPEAVARTIGMAQPKTAVKTTGSLAQPDTEPARRPVQPETITATSTAEVRNRPAIDRIVNQPSAPVRQSVTLPKSRTNQPVTNQLVRSRQPVQAASTPTPAANVPPTLAGKLPPAGNQPGVDENTAESTDPTSPNLNRTARKRQSTVLRKGSQPDRQLVMQQRPNPATPGLLNAGTGPALPPTRARNPETADAIPPAERINTPAQPDSRSTVAATPSSNRTDTLATARPVALPPATVPAKPDSAVVMAAVVRPDTVAQTDSKPVTSKPVRQNGLSFMVLVSPDLTTVGLTNFAQPGTNYGLMLDYRFARRWSVQTGVIRSTKIYNALSNQYKYPSTWKLDVPFDAVAGRCQMLDLPLNVRFDVLTGKRPVTSNGAVTRLFVSAGVTTYIMLQETYDYIYDDPNDPRIVFRTWKGKTGRYNFSQANFSMGYERPIAGKWSVQAEPFIKIPIEQVGFFKVRLISTGIFLGLRYKL